MSLGRKVGAEFIGTLILIFAGTATAIVNQKTQGAETLIGLAASTGIAVMIAILSTGHISGAHLNPSITIAFATLKHFPWKHVPVYIGAQILASVCAAFALKAIFDPIMGGGVTVPSVGYGVAFALEFAISFILMFVVTAVATDTRAVGELAGLAVGATVMLNILIAGNATGASMNPVRTLGPAIAANNYKAIWVYLTAPILGALCGAGTYTIIKRRRNPFLLCGYISNLYLLPFSSFQQQPITTLKWAKAVGIHPDPVRIEEPVYTLREPRQQLERPKDQRQRP